MIPVPIQIRVMPCSRWKVKPKPTIDFDFISNCLVAICLSAQFEEIRILTIRIANYCSTFLRGISGGFMIQDCIEIQRHLLIFGNFGQVQQILLTTPFGSNCSLLIELTQIPQVYYQHYSQSKGCTINPVSIIFGTGAFAGGRDPESSNSNTFQGGNVASETSVVFTVSSNIPFERLEHCPILRGRSVN